MELNSRIDRLDDREVLLVLSHLAGEIAATHPVESEDEARVAVAAFLGSFGDSPVSPEQIAADDPTSADTRALLAALLDDPDTLDATSDLIEDPPGDDQLVLETAAAIAVLLAVTISWLQTKVELDITIEEGKRQIHFSAKKDATDPNVIKDVVAILRRTLIGD